MIFRVFSNQFLPSQRWIYHPFILIFEKMYFIVMETQESEDQLERY